MLLKPIYLSALVCAVVALTSSAEASPPSSAEASPPSTSKCYPSCRGGFICSPDGRCVSPCNPPCGDGETCTTDHRCELTRTQSLHTFVLLGGFGVRTERISFILGVGHADEKYNGTLTSFAFDVALSYELGRVHAFYTSIVGSLLVDLIPDEVNDDDDAQMRGGGSLSFGYRYLPAKHSAFGFGVGAFGRVTSPYREFVCAGFGVELKALFQHGLFRLELFASPGLNINAELPRYYARLPLFAMGMGFRAGAAI